VNAVRFSRLVTESLPPLSSALSLCSVRLVVSVPPRTPCCFRVSPVLRVSQASSGDARTLEAFTSFMRLYHELATKMASQNADQMAIVRQLVFSTGAGAAAIAPAHGKHHGYPRAKGTSATTSASAPDPSSEDANRWSGNVLLPTEPALPSPVSPPRPEKVAIHAGGLFVGTSRRSPKKRSGDPRLSGSIAAKKPKSLATCP